MKAILYVQKRYVIVTSILLLIASFTSQKIWADRHDEGHSRGYHERYSNRTYGRYYPGNAYYRLYRPYQYYYYDYPYYYYPYYYRPYYLHPFASLYSFFIRPSYSYSYYNYPDDETIGFYSSKKILSIIVDGKKLQPNSPHRTRGNGTYFLHLEKGSHKIKWTVRWADGDIETYSRRFKVGPEGQGGSIFIDGERFYQE